MGPRQRKHKTKHSKSLERKERDQETIRAVNQLLDAEPVSAKLCLTRAHLSRSLKQLSACLDDCLIPPFEASLSVTARLCLVRQGCELRSGAASPDWV